VLAQEAPERLRSEWEAVLQEVEMKRRLGKPTVTDHASSPTNAARAAHEEPEAQQPGTDR